MEATNDRRFLVLGHDSATVEDREAREALGVVDIDERELRREKQRAAIAWRRAAAPVAWWLPLGCKRGGAVLVGGVKAGASCGARGCLWCHRTKLTQHVEGANLLPRIGDERGYHVRFTPTERAMTREDVADFLRRVRGLLREWQQEHGLGACWWVAEVVERDGFSNIECPRRTKPQGSWLWKYDQGTRDLVEREHARCDLAHELPQAERCRLCHGTGRLPLVHLHVHVVMWAKPFWFGDSTDPRASQFHRFRHGEGFAGFYKRHGLGSSRAEKIRTTAGAIAYISKACLLYVAKGAEVAKAADGKTGKRKRRDVDHDGSQRGAELAAAVYGLERHRGKLGRAYGVKLRQRDAGRCDGFTPGEAPAGEMGPARAAACPGGVATLAVRRQAKRKALALQRARGLGPAPAPSQLVQIALVGVRAAAVLNLEVGEGSDFGADEAPAKRDQAKRKGTSVPVETQVARKGNGPSASEDGADVAEGLAPSVVLVDQDGGEREASRVTGGNIAKAWIGTPVIPAGEWWYSWATDGLLVGRGDVCTLLPLSGLEGQDREKLRARGGVAELRERLGTMVADAKRTRDAFDLGDDLGQLEAAEKLGEWAAKRLAALDLGAVPKLNSRQWGDWARELVLRAMALRSASAMARDLTKHAGTRWHRVDPGGEHPRQAVHPVHYELRKAAKGAAAGDCDAWSVQLRHWWQGDEEEGTDDVLACVGA